LALSLVSLQTLTCCRVAEVDTFAPSDDVTRSVAREHSLVSSGPHKN
jgi:hypothetical protein